MRSKMMGFNILTYFILFSVGFLGGFRYLKELIMHCASTHGLLLPTPVRLMPYRLRSCAKLV